MLTIYERSTRYDLSHYRSKVGSRITIRRVQRAKQSEVANAVFKSVQIAWHKAMLGRASVARTTNSSITSSKQQFVRHQFEDLRDRAKISDSWSTFIVVYIYSITFFKLELSSFFHGLKKRLVESELLNLFFEKRYHCRLTSVQYGWRYTGIQVQERMKVYVSANSFVVNIRNAHINYTSRGVLISAALARRDRELQAKGSLQSVGRRDCTNLWYLSLRLLYMRKTSN